jgi:threonyl-tRNA synthetase
MSSEQAADAPKPPAGDEKQLPVRPAKEGKPKEAKAKAKGGKNASLEVSIEKLSGRRFRVKHAILTRYAVLQLPALPEFIQHRLDVFDRIKARQDAEIAGTQNCVRKEGGLYD